MVIMNLAKESCVGHNLAMRVMGWLRAGKDSGVPYSPSQGKDCLNFGPGGKEKNQRWENSFKI